MMYCARGHKQEGTYQGTDENDRCQTCGMYCFATEHDAKDFAEYNLDHEPEFSTVTARSEQGG